MARAASVVMDEHARDSLLGDARASLIKAYGLTPGVMAALQGDGVAAEFPVGRLRGLTVGRGLAARTPSSCH